MKTMSLTHGNLIPGQFGAAAAAVALPPAIAGGAAIAGGIYFGPEAVAFVVQGGTIYILGNARLYQNAVNFIRGYLTPYNPPPNWGYVGSAARIGPKLIGDMTDHIKKDGSCDKK